MEKGILYICGTPIGNLEDISLRVLSLLKEVDLIAAEDTRHSAKLLNHFGISTPLTSYHEHNKKIKGMKLIEEILAGKNIALVSDAGMPGISDPGEDLIKLCYENNIKVTAAPGPTALVTALVLSGLSTRRYVFEGFLPTDKKELEYITNEIKDETRTIVIYESPHHLMKTLNHLYSNLGNRKIAVIREITKFYEEVVRGEIKEIIEIFSAREIKGEFVIVIEGKNIETVLEEDKAKWQEISVEEHMEIYSDLPKKDAMKKVAKDRGISKREVYDMLLKKS